MFTESRQSAARKDGEKLGGASPALSSEEATTAAADLELLEAIDAREGMTDDEAVTYTCRYTITISWYLYAVLHCRGTKQCFAIVCWYRRAEILRPTWTCVEA
jgi:hypothetical protein